jgi:hypothetical protein
VAIALIEAKKDTLPPGHGLDQAKGYLAASRHNVLFVFSSNGHLFVEFDRTTGMTESPRPLSEFPTPAELRARYERIMGFSLEAPVAKPLLARYPGGEGQRGYFQDAAIRAVLERVAQNATTGRPPRALLSLATGTGKTFIACNLLKWIADAGQLTPGIGRETDGRSRVSQVSTEEASTRAATSGEACSLDKVTRREPSRSCHGEGHVCGASVPGCTCRRSRRGRGRSTRARRGTKHERPVCAARVGAARLV